MTYEKESEKEFGTYIEDLLRRFGFEFDHVYEQARYARRSTVGRPDYFAIKPPRFLVIELKSETGKVTLEQKWWLDRCSAIEVIETYLWRPADREEAQEIILLGHVPNLIERSSLKCSWVNRRSENV